MKDPSRTNQELIEDNALLKQRIQELEPSEAARKQAERRQYLAIEILGILNDPTALADSINLILAAIKRETGFDAVGIRLRSGDDFPYFVQNGFSHDFLHTENTLIARDANGGPCKDENGNISLECTCGLVVSGQTDPANPLFTEAGSSWTNNSLPFLDLPAEQDPRLHPRNKCIHQGYLSVALIPIRANREIVGLLQLNDREKDCFTLDMIHFFEGISASIGVALLRKRAEEALRESEKRYKSLTENMNDILWTCDLDMNITYLSPSIEKVLGFTTEERMKQAPADQMPAEVLTLAVEVLAEELRYDKERALDRYISLEMDYFHKDGSVRCMDTSLSFIRNDKGKPIGIHGLSRDITEYKKAEKALRESEKLFRMITHNARDVIWMLDMNFQFTYMSPSIEQMLGYPVDEYLSKPHSDFILPDSLDHLYKVLEEELAAEGGPNSDPYRSRTVETEQIHRNGSRLWVELKMSFMRDADGKPIGILGFSRDITERKRAEEALRKSEAKYRLITEKMTDSVWTADRELRLTYVSPSDEKLVGFTAAERMAQSFGEILTPSSQEKALEILSCELAREKEDVADPHRSVLMEWENYRKDGTTIWLETTISGIRDDDGTLIGFHGVDRDITERKRAEEEREKWKEQLDRAQKMEAIGTLAGGVAHDFNNLLMGIQGHASLMMLGLDVSHPHHVRLKHVEELVQSGADLTGQLLGFARGGRYAVRPTDMNEIVEKTSSMFGRTRKEIIIHKQQKKELWSVEVDRTQMEQVLMNLYVNAWHAMPGGGEITLGTDNVLLTDSVALPLIPGKYVKITVSDTGTGMDAKTRERIFDPFFTTKGMGRGTGLGLATVYGIIKGHGGMIDVTSEPGQGTTFKIYLPATDKSIAGEAAAGQDVLRGAGTILLVDDEGMVLNVAREMLESLGYQRSIAWAAARKPWPFIMRRRTRSTWSSWTWSCPAYRAGRHSIASGRSIRKSGFCSPAVTASTD